MLIGKRIYNFKGYLLTCRNAEVVHCQRKFGNPCSTLTAEVNNQFGRINTSKSAE